MPPPPHGALLDYRVAIDNPAAVVARLRGLRRGAPLRLPSEAGALRLWETLAGRVPQRRAWVFGRAATLTADDAAAAAAAATGDCCEPVSIHDGVVFVSASAGRAHGAAANAHGHVFTWGARNDRGQLGIGATDSSGALTAGAAASPIASRALVYLDDNKGSSGGSDAGSSSSSSNSSSGSHARSLERADSLALLARSVQMPAPLLGALRAARGTSQAQRETAAVCGNPEEPPSGQGAALHIFRLDIGQAVAMVACGGAHTLVSLCSSGLVAWGENCHGQCGIPAAVATAVTTPSRVHAFDGLRLVHVSAGARHSAAVLADGALATFGHGRGGRLGVGGEPETQPPSAVGGALRGERCVAAACGSAHTLALAASGRVYAFGYGGRGALGVGLGGGRDENALLPVLVPGLRPCVAIAAGAASFAVGRGGEAYAWGDCLPAACRAATSSTDGEQGHPLPHHQHAPLACMSGLRARSVACGVDGAAAFITDEGALVLLSDGGGLVPPSLRARAQPPGGAAAGASAAAEGEAAPTPPWRWDPGTEPPEAASLGDGCAVLLTAPAAYEPGAAEVRRAALAVIEAYARACAAGLERGSAPLLGSGSVTGSGGSGSGCGVGPASEAGTIASRRARSCAAPTIVSMRVAGGCPDQRNPSAKAEDGLGVAQGPPKCDGGITCSSGSLAPSKKTVGFRDLSGAASPVAQGAAAAAVLPQEPGDSSGRSSSPAELRRPASASDSKRVRVAPLLLGHVQLALATSLPSCQGEHALDLWGLLMLCREAGLLDDATEHADVAAAFAAALHRRAARRGPSVQSSPPQPPQPQQPPATSPQPPYRLDHRQQGSSSDGDGESGELPDQILLVPVQRPGKPLRASAASQMAAASAGGGGVATCSGTAAAAANPAVAAAEGLTPCEVLEALLHLVSERHPPLRGDAEALLRALAARYLLRLRRRRPDRGPPWLLCQALQPAALAAAEAEAALLHGVYVYLSGGGRHDGGGHGSGARSDLALGLEDARLGMRRAAVAAEERSRVAHDEAEAGGARAQVDKEQQQPQQLKPCGVQLGRLASFLRASGAAPRLFALYAAHLQRLAPRGGGRQGSGDGSAPLMPMLRLPVRARAPSRANAQYQQQQQRTRGGGGGGLGALSEGSGSDSGGGGGGGGGGASPSAGSLPRAGSLSRSVSARRRSPSPTFDSSKDTWAAAAAAAVAAAAAAFGGVDARLLDDAELLPARSRRATIMLDPRSGDDCSGGCEGFSDGDEEGDGGGFSGPRRGAVGEQRRHAVGLRVQLPGDSGSDAEQPSRSLRGRGPVSLPTFGRSHLTAGTGSGGGGCGLGGSLVNAVATTPAAAGGSQRRRELTYQEQQTALRAAADSAAAAKAAAAEAEAQRQDAWLVFVLAELLGSYVLGPESIQTGWQQQPQQQQAAAAAPSTPPVQHAGPSRSPSRGRLAPPPADAAAAAAAAAAAGASSTRSPAVDLMSARVPYTVFVEVLLVCAAARCSAAIDLGAHGSNGGAPPPALLPCDGELREHIGSVLGAVRRWRDATLAGASCSGVGGGGESGAQPMEAAVRDAYARYCSLDARCVYGRHARRRAPRAVSSLDGADGGGGSDGSDDSGDDGGSGDGARTAFAVDAGGFKRLLADARLCRRRSSKGGGSAKAAKDLPSEEQCMELFEGFATGRFAAQKQQHQHQHQQQHQQQRGGVSPPLLGAAAAVRQSSFARRVAAERLAQLLGVAPGAVEVPQEAPDLKVDAPLEQQHEEQQQPQRPGPAPAPARRGPQRRVLTRAQFSELVGRLVALRFPGVANAQVARRLLVEKHLMRALARRGSRFDAYSAAARSPGVQALLLAWRPDLEALARRCAATPARRPSVGLRRLFALLQRAGALPNPLAPADVERALRRLRFDAARGEVQGRGEGELVRGLLPGEFGELLAILALAALAPPLAPRGTAAAGAGAARQPPLQPPARPIGDVAEFFVGALGLPPLPPHAALLAGAAEDRPAGCGLPAGGAAAVLAGAAAACGVRSEGSYDAWWSLELHDPPPGGAGHATGAVGDPQELVLLLEPAAPPRGCPRRVRRLARAAADAASDPGLADGCAAALKLIREARAVWHAKSSDSDSSTPEEDASLAEEHEGAAATAPELLPARMALFLALAEAGPLAAARRDADALAALLDKGAPALEWLPEAGADAAAWHAAAGAVRYHLGDLRAAYEHCARAYVARCECAALGPSHAATAAAAHNLGCALLALGRADRAAPLARGAAAALAGALGRDHPRALVAAATASRAEALHAAGRSDGGVGGNGGGVGGSGAPSLGSLQARLASAVDARLRRSGERGANGDGAAAAAAAAAAGAGGAADVVAGSDDPEPLGGGLCRAAPSVRRRYGACRGDVAARAAGAPPGGLSGRYAHLFAAGALGFDGDDTSALATVELQVAAAPPSLTLGRQQQQQPPGPVLLRRGPV